MNSAITRIAVAVGLVCALTAPAVALADTEPNGDIAHAEFMGTWMSAMGTISDGSSPTPDEVDIYSFDLAEGEYLEFFVQATETVGADLNMALYPPGTVDGALNNPVFWSGSPLNRDFQRFSVPTGGAGRYYMMVYGQTGGQPLDYAFTQARDGAGDTSGVERYAGADRYETASFASMYTLPSNSGGKAVVATGRGFADALAASALAGAAHGPLLLTAPGAIDSFALSEMFRIGVTGVYVVGGTSAVSDAVIRQIEDAGIPAANIERLGGADRYVTAVVVADEVARLGVADAAPVTRAFVVRGDAFPDALSCAPYAYAERIPILLTPRTELAPLTGEFIEDNALGEILVAGGTSAVSAGVAGEIDALAGGSVAVARLAGDDRYETAMRIADVLTQSPYDFNIDRRLTAFATGRDFPDALAGGAMIGYEAGVLLLLDPAGVRPDITAWLHAHRSEGDDFIMLGGGSALSMDVERELWGVLDALPPGP